MNAIPEMQNPDKLFKDIRQFISESKALLDKGALMELAGLDDRVRTLCETVMSLTAENRVQYADQLQQVLGELKVLGEAMAAQRDAMTAEIQNISQHKKANVAYRVADASDNFGEPDDETQ